MTETHEFVEREGRPTAEVWEIPRRVWGVLASWGLAVLVLAGLLSFWIWTNQREAEQAQARAELEKDRAMCVMLDLFISGPPPPAGPAGDRGRAVVAAMTAYQVTLRCNQLGPPTR
jgi:hypothetical protein